MSLPINIEDLMGNGVVESSRIEYKANWNPEPILRTICAFANDLGNLGGGYIVVGVNAINGYPSLPIEGISKDSIDTINQELFNICNRIVPRYIPDTDIIDYEGKLLFVIWAPGGNDRPYKCPIRISERAEKAIFIRKLASTIKANPQEEKDLYKQASIIPYDDSPNPNASIRDLEPALIENYLYQVKSRMLEEKNSLIQLAQSLRIVAGSPENFHPLNVGLLFFNYRPDNFFRYARIEVVDKPDPTGIGMTEKIFYGPLVAQLQSALIYINSYIITEKVVKFARVAETDRMFNYPIVAVQEALTNAVHHRSYQIHEPIIVTATPDYIEILSHPGPDASITDEDLKACKMIGRTYRNRRIGDFLKEFRLVEGRNTGIPSMLRALKANGNDMPIFETDAERKYFLVTIPIHPAFKIQVDPTKNVEQNKSVKWHPPGFGIWLMMLTFIKNIFGN
jgi:ATP-dependent DNA helicase RecG